MLPIDMLSFRWESTEYLRVDVENDYSVAVGLLLVFPSDERVLQSTIFEQGLVEDMRPNNLYRDRFSLLLGYLEEKGRL